MDNITKIEKYLDILKKENLYGVDSIDIKGNFKKDDYDNEFGNNGFFGRIINDGIIYCKYDTYFRCYDSRENWGKNVIDKFLIGKNVFGYNFKANVINIEDEEIENYSKLICKCLMNNITDEYIKQELNLINFQSEKIIQNKQKIIKL